MGQHGAGAHAERRAAGHTEVGQRVPGRLFVERPLVGEREAAAPVLNGEGDAGVAAFVDATLEDALRGDALDRLVVDATETAPTRLRVAPLEVGGQPVPRLP